MGHVVGASVVVLVPVVVLVVGIVIWPLAGQHTAAVVVVG